MCLRIEDVWHHEGFDHESESLGFSWSDRHIGEVNLSCLDWFYVSD